MRRLLAIVAIILAASAAGWGQSPDALAAVREALGGESRLSAISSFSVSGSLTSYIAPGNVKNDVDIYCVLPDKFVRIMRRWMSDPSGSIRVTDYAGFNGVEPIRDIVAPGSRVPMFIATEPEPSTPTEIAAARARQAFEGHQAFVDLVLPLFATSFAGYPLRFTPAGQVDVKPGLADAIDTTAPNGFVRRLILDRSSHLPIKILWENPAPMVASMTSAVAVSSRGDVVQLRGANRLPAASPGRPPLVEWETTIAEYRVTDGVNWPHRFTTTIAGKKYQELRLDTFKINPAVDPKTFAARVPTPTRLPAR